MIFLVLIIFLRSVAKGVGDNESDDVGEPITIFLGPTPTPSWFTRHTTRGTPQEGMIISIVQVFFEFRILANLNPLSAYLLHAFHLTPSHSVYDKLYNC